MVFAVVMMAGCTEETSPTEGLSIKFTENQPPAKVMDNAQETFGISVTMKNEGEARIPRGKVIGTLSGIDANAFGLMTYTAVSEHDIRGKEKQNGEVIEGDTETIDFGDASYTPKLTVDFQTSVKADVCYNYESYAVFSICLKRNTVQKESDKDICKIEETKSVQNSGAPLQISNMKETGGGNSEVKFTFNIDRIGGGTVYAVDTFNAQTGCTENDNGKNTVTVIVEPQSPDVIVSCTRLNGGNQGSIKLYDGKGTVVCEINTQNLQETAFESPVNIIVKYMYKDSVKKDIVVRKS